MRIAARCDQADKANGADEADGGSGLDKVSDCIVREELSYMSQGFASSWSAHSHLGIWPIWKAGTESQMVIEAVTIR